MKNLTTEQFKKAAVILSSAFPDRKFDPEIYYELLKDLNGECFLAATIEVVKSVKQLYPGTNLIAILRDRTFEIVRANQARLYQVPQISWQPDPKRSLKKEFEEMLEKLAKEKTA